MNKIQYNMIYLAACGVDKVIPNKEFLNGVDSEKLYHLSGTHFLDALVGTTLKQAGVVLPKAWNEKISKAIRKVVLFDAERAKLFSFLEQKGIWYLPLKGIVLKDYYPAVGMRQMSDNDILFDGNFCDEVRSYMESQGYETVSVDVSIHDVYKKEPVYNFEMHHALFSELHQDGFAEYYRNIKDRLVLNDTASYGYHFTDEDFYVYLKAKTELDFAYIEKEMLSYYLSSGVYGTIERGVENSVKKLGRNSIGLSKLKYMWKRLFPGDEVYQYYAGSVKNKAMRALTGWFCRLFTVLFHGKRRTSIVRELKAVKKVK